MKVLVTAVVVVMMLATGALAAVENTTVTALSDTTFIIVQPVDGGSILEVMEIKNGKITIVDSLRYVRTSEIGGGYSIQFERVEKIEKK